ncbi:uncharacterized protein LOC117104248 [Anneissia japonica]|uniref:uncharacterized protein LOC117104248 n=1 Tax=Anneissia japonica TaxID=1529436 RepID=UPI0014254D94|nr:uncharacterized protein LOC117104248 [Anneissia japonica]XP_033100849.1 uncharacterized protein LOC117104248 [Anneissia japonica]XP_033100850.1 uncharacterized protein LOC117104248 [Anneissia japonica]
MNINLTEICKENPVISGFNLDNHPGIISYLKANLKDGRDVPTTICDLLADFIDDQVFQFENAEYIGLGRSMINSEVSQRILKILGKVSLETRYENPKNGHLLPSHVLQRHFPSFTELQARQYSFDFLRRHEKEPNYFIFSNRVMQDYVIAMWCCSSLEDAITSNLHISSALEHCLQLLPATSNVCSILAGLIAKFHPEKLRGYLRTLVKASSVNDIAEHDLQIMMVESVYEAKGGDLCAMVEELLPTLSISIKNNRIHHLPYVVSAIGYFVQHSNFLSSVDLSNAGIDTSIVPFFTSHIVDETPIQSMNFRNNNLGPDGLQSINLVLSLMTSLIYIELSECNIGNKGFKNLASSIKYMPLVHLRVQKNGITDDGFIVAVENVCYCDTLELIDVSNNSITNKSTVAFSKKLCHLKKLRSLDMSENLISDDGISAIAVCLHEVQNLTFLQLASNRVGLEGAMSIAENLHKVPKLTHLNLSGNEIPLQGLFALNSARKNHSVANNLRISGQKSSTCFNSIGYSPLFSTSMSSLKKMSDVDLYEKCESMSELAQKSAQSFQQRLAVNDAMSTLDDAIEYMTNSLKRESKLRRTQVWRELEEETLLDELGNGSLKASVQFISRSSTLDRDIRSKKKEEQQEEWKTRSLDRMRMKRKGLRLEIKPHAIQEVYET